MARTTTGGTTPTSRRAEVDFEGMDPEMAATMREAGVQPPGSIKPPAPLPVKPKRKPFDWTAINPFRRRTSPTTIR